jgi:hypothetical protein
MNNTGKQNYAINQYHLACRELGINALSSDPGDTLLEAVCGLKSELTETRKDYKCLAELLDGHDATECRANLLRMKDELDEMTARAISLSMHLPPQTLAGDIQKWRDEALEEMNSLQRELAEARELFSKSLKERESTEKEVDAMLERVIAAEKQRDALAEAMIPAMTRAYARGYNHGHEDTVESTFMTTHASDELTFFADDIRQMLLDGSQPEAQAALAARKEGA